MSAHEYETSLPRAALGLPVGTIAGAALVTVALLPVHDLAYFLTYGLPTVAAVFIYAIFFWAVGLALVAPVPWVLLHHRRWRGWPSAMTLGVVLTFIVTFGMFTHWFGLDVPAGLVAASDSGGRTVIDGRLTPHGWFAGLQLALACSAAGALVGLVVWRTAYRRVPR